MNRVGRIKKGIPFILLSLCLLYTTSCISKYPITIYDKDLAESDRLRIVEEVDQREIDRQKEKEKKKTSATTTKSRSTDESLDASFLEFEKEETLNIKEESTFPVVTLFKNQPDFDLKKYTNQTFENYSDLDSLGRVGKAEAMLGKETMPTTAREGIGMIKPSGWHTIKYENIDGKYLYNRCHLIGWQLSAENANEKNLFTGTRYLNVEGMLPFESKVSNYIKSTGNHVLYRVTPYFSGNNLVASHIQIEAMSFEDNGEGICFNVKLENIQPSIHINYLNGDSFSEVVSSTASETMEGANTDV